MDISVTRRLEVWHKDYNLEKRDNLRDLPAEKAVFGVFASVNEEPVNCRYAGETEDLRAAIKMLFEKPGTEGLKKFMQGAWIQTVQFELMPGSSAVDRKKVLDEWIEKHQPKIDDDGDYPGYYNA